jgi:triosephosphate isomerase (TIM)
MAKSDRMPLMAGNWKMNINHFEAIALVQKLAFALNESDFAAVEVAVIPPFTDLRSVQTLILGDKYDIKYGAQDHPMPREPTLEIFQAQCWQNWAAPSF